MPNVPDDPKGSRIGASGDIKSAISQNSESEDLAFAMTLNATLGIDTRTIEVATEAPKTPKKAKYLSEGAVINGRYTVDKVLGEGGMGVVYKVTDKLNPERMLALKTLRAANISEEQLAMFQAEFKTMSKLYHPNVASVYDFEPIQGTEDYLFTLDFVKGKELDESIEGKDLKDILELLVQVCRALSYMHSRKIIHFDLKPQNVLVDMDGNAKVLDFGIAGAKQIAGSGGGLVGTPHYMAPEIVLDRSTLDHRFDLYSLGIMIFQLFVGNVPYTATTLRELIKLHCFQLLEFDDEAKKKMPGWLIDLVNHLCEKNPADRIRSANTVIEFINKEGGFSFEVETQETRESYILSTRFVGRKKEFSHVTGFIDNRLKGQDVAGRPILFVTGQSGIGKSRLMREVRFHAQLARQVFIEGNCYESSASEYGPLAEVLGYLVALAQASGADNLLDSYAQSLIKVEPNLVQTLKTKPVEFSGDAAAEQLALMEDISSFILQLSNKSPFAVYINDLQWARKGTINILSYLLEIISQQDRLEKRPRLAIMGSYRDDEITGKPIATALNALKEREELDALILGPFDEEQVNLALKSMLGVDTIPEEFGRRVMDETAGNPFFVESAMRVLVENGTVYLENGEWAASTEVGEIEIPSIPEVFLRRISLLDDAQRTVLEVIAVCGLPTSPTVINKVCQMDSDIFHEALTVLLQRQMVKRAEGTKIKYVTNHDRMRETVYQNLESEKIKGLHQGIAETIESVYAENLDLHFAVLARHYSSSDNREKALKYCIAAGNQAKENYANELAIEMFQKVLDLLPKEELTSPLGLEISEKLGDCYYLIGGKYHEAQSCFEKVLSYSNKKLDKARQIARIGNCQLQRGELGPSIDKYWNAIRLLGGSRPWIYMLSTVVGLSRNLFYNYFPWHFRRTAKGDKEKRISELIGSYLQLGVAYYFHDPMSMALPGLRAANIAEKYELPHKMAHAFSMLTGLYATLSLYKPALKVANRGTAIARELNDPWLIGMNLALRALLFQYWGKNEEAIEDANEAIEKLLKSGDIFLLANAYIHIWWANYSLGDIKACLETVIEMDNMITRTGAYQMAKFAKYLFIWVYTYCGSFDDANSYYEQYMELVDKNDQFSICGAFLVKGYMNLFKGEIDEAICELTAAMELKERENLMHDYFAVIYGRLTQATLEKIRFGAVDKKARTRLLKTCKKLIRKALSTNKKHPNYMPNAVLASAIYNRVKGNKSKAKKLFAKCRQVAEEQKGKLHLAEAYYEEGQCMLEDGEPAELYRVLLEKALRLYEKCGATLYVSRVQELLEQKTDEIPVSNEKAHA